MNKKITMQRGSAVIIIALLTLALLLSSCATVEKTDTTPFVKTMIRFDRAFIPALAMTSKGDPAGSVRAMSILSGEWTVIKPELIAFYPNDKIVASSMEAVDKSIMEASAKLAANAPLSEIHVILEAVKKPFIDIRVAKKIDYYPDLLDLYHSTMEEILSITADKTAAEISTTDMRLIKDLSVKGVDQWNVIQAGNLDSALFGFNESKTVSLKKSIEEGKNEAMSFVSTVESGDKEAVIKMAAGLKSFYTRVYLQFGDFERLKK